MPTVYMYGYGADQCGLHAYVSNWILASYDCLTKLSIVCKLTKFVRPDGIWQPSTFRLHPRLTCHAALQLGPTTSSRSSSLSIILLNMASAQ